MNKTANERFYDTQVRQFPTLYTYDADTDKVYEVWNTITPGTIFEKEVYAQLISTGHIFCEITPDWDRIVDFKEAGRRVSFFLKGGDSVEDIYNNILDDDVFYTSTAFLIKELRNLEIKYTIEIVDDSNDIEYGDKVYLWGDKGIFTGIVYGKYLSDSQEHLMLTIESGKENEHKITRPVSSSFLEVEDLFKWSLKELKEKGL